MGFEKRTGIDRERRAFEEDELDSIVGWRHVGIVDVTREQARRSLAATGLLEAVESLSERTASELRQARTRDPDAPVFQSGSLVQLIRKAVATAQLRIADAVSNLAIDIHPGDAA